MKTRALFALIFAAALLRAADYPAPVEGDWVVRDFRFHTGETLPELRLHYVTVGARTGEPVLILHGTNGTGGGFLRPGFRGRVVRAGPAAGCGDALPHHAGCDWGGEVVEAVRWNAHEIPAVQLRRYGRRAIPLGEGSIWASGICAW